MTVRSIHHPGGQRRPWLALQAQAQMVSVLLLVVIVGGLTAALQGHAILAPVAVAMVGGYTVALAVSQWRLRETPAEVEIVGPAAVVRSIWDAAPGPRRDEVLPVFEARLRAGELHVSLGDSVRTFRPDEWPEFDQLVDAFRDAARQAAPLPADES